MYECFCTPNIQYFPSATQFSDQMDCMPCDFADMWLTGLPVMCLSKVKPRFIAVSDDEISPGPI